MELLCVAGRNKSVKSVREYEFIYDHSFNKKYVPITFRIENTRVGLFLGLVDLADPILYELDHVMHPFIFWVLWTERDHRTFIVS